MENYPKPINKQILQNILEQMNKSIYKFSTKKEKFDMGFFCKIKFRRKIIPVAIINNYQFDKEYQNKINVLINNEEKIINLGNRRYRNKDYNISILELNDETDNVNFIELDNNFGGLNSESFYSKESIYIIQRNELNDIYISYGFINKINGGKLIYSANLIPNFIFCLIYNTSNNKLIGIHQNKPKYYNKGILLDNIINQFKNTIRHNQNYMNEIHIRLNIEENDVNKNIYFLDNYEYEKDRKRHYHDNLKELNQLNTELSINNEIATYNKYFIPEKKGEYNIKLKFNLNLTDCSYMFAGCNNIMNIKFISLNSENVENMKYMFYNCENIEIIDLSSIDTKKVTDMRYMFYNCKKLNNINLSSFNTNKVKNMGWMFYQCNNLNFLNLEYFDTGKVEDMNSMFYDCHNINNLNLDNFDTKNVTNMSKMFYNCKSLDNLDLYSFDTGKVTNMNAMFFGCTNLTSLNITSFNTTNVDNMSYMFYACKNLKDVNLSYLDTSNVRNKDGIFYECHKLNNLSQSILDLI